MTDHTTPEDTAVSHAEEPQPPIPAEGAPHAYVAIRRTHSVNADRPEWETDPHLIPAHEVDELIYWNTQPDVSLLPIGPDGDTGTRAIGEPRTLPTSKDALYLRENGSKIRLIGPAYEHHDLRKYCLSLASLAPELWVGELTAPNGHVEPCLVTGENLAALGYTLVTEEGPNA